jgi:hypothetical protein
LLRLTAGARPILSGRELRVTSPASGLLAERLLDAGMANPVVSSVPEPPDAAYAFVVPVRDRPRELDRLLTSIGTGHPVIVVDDASQRPEAVEAVAVTHGVKFLPLATNVGPAGARNAGLRLVTTPYVVFVDSDVVLTPDTVTTLLKHFTDPKVAMAVPRITALSTSNSTNWLGHYENARSSLDLDAHPVAVRPGTPVSWAPTVCAVARTDALRHGFGERMRVGEDVDLCWRLIESAAYGTGAHPLAERHPRFIAAAVPAPWSTALILTLLARRRWSLPAAGALCGITAVRIARKPSGTEDPYRLALRLTAHGAVAALSQASALMTRRWWPLTAVGRTASRRIRRATAVAALTDTALEYHRDRAPWTRSATASLAAATTSHTGPVSGSPRSRAAQQQPPALALSVPTTTGSPPDEPDRRDRGRGGGRRCGAGRASERGQRPQRAAVGGRTDSVRTFPISRRPA